jgi:hypothetical protein
MLQKATGLLMATMLLSPIVYLASASAQVSSGLFEPGKLKGPAQGRPNEVMVIGTPHLSQLPASFQPAGLRLVGERLQAWQPGIIIIEQRSGPQQ